MLRMASYLNSEAPDSYRDKLLNNSPIHQLNNRTDFKINKSLKFFRL